MNTLQPSIEQTQQLPAVPTSFMIEQDDYEVRCRMCSKESNVDKEMFCQVNAAIESGKENPFLCEVCVDLV